MQLQKPSGSKTADTTSKQPSFNRQYDYGLYLLVSYTKSWASYIHSKYPHHFSIITLYYPYINPRSPRRYLSADFSGHWITGSFLTRSRLQILSRWSMEEEMGETRSIYGGNEIASRNHQPTKNKNKHSDMNRKVWLETEKKQQLIYSFICLCFEECLFIHT